MTLQMDGTSDCSSSQKADEEKGALNRHCDKSDSFLDGDNWNESMDTNESHQQRILRSVTRNSFGPKRIKFSPDDYLPDSEDENELVIDIDFESSTEENSKKETSTSDNDQGKKYTLRPKSENNGLVNWRSFDEVLDVSEESTFGTEDDKKQIQEKWLNVSKSRKKHRMRKRFLKSKKDAEENNEMKDQDEGREKNQCPICEEQFTNVHSFTIHIREHNTDKSTHVCKICLKQLSSASSLDRHMYVHSGERPFECQICRLRFTTNGNMHRHMKTHSSGPQEQPKAKKRSSDANLSSSDNSRDPEEENYDLPADFSRISESSVCQVCGKEFLSPLSLQCHMQFHPSHPIKCSACKSTSLNYADYLKHSCMVENKENGRCKTTNAKVGFYDLTFIEFSSSKFPLVAKNLCETQARDPSSPYFSYECDTCAKAFPSNKALEMHEISHIKNKNKTCSPCKCDFPTVKCHQNHQLKHRPVEQITNEHTESQKEDFMAMLQLCKATTNPPPEKKRKLKYFDNINYFVNSSQTYDSMNESSDFADIGSIISLTCKAALPNLRASPVAASPASPIPETINDIFPVSPVIEGSAANPIFESAVSEIEECSLISHEESIPLTTRNESGEWFNCRKCTESFTSPNDLKEHVKTHSKSCVHKCKFCPYQTMDKSTLKRHLRKHNGEHPFKCSICDYVFTTKANGHRHVKNKHKVSEQEAADAVVYNPNMQEGKDLEGFTEPSSTETVCKYCKQDFKYNRVLRHHLRSLNNSCSRKPYSCNVCKQGFSTKNNCIRHITNHHPEHRDKAKELAIANDNINNSSSQENNESNSDEASEDESIIEPLNLVIPELEENLELEFPDSDAETLKVAESLISLQGLPAPQESPLDLTLQALNLSMKSNQFNIALIAENMSQQPTQSTSKLSSDAVLNPAQVKSGEKITDANQDCPINLSFRKSDVQSNALNLVSNSLSLVNNIGSSESTSNNSIPLIILPLNNLSTKNNTAPDVLSTSVEPLSAALTNINELTLSDNLDKTIQKAKKFSCEICFKGFTLKSNRERHIKNHHPEHARPPRSRNYIPTLSPTSIQKQGSSTCTDRTRDALRIALIAKSGFGSSKSSKTVDTQLPAVPISPSTSKKSTVDKSHSSSMQNRNDSITDLASVSAVIDAVNCQPFKEYLNEANKASGSENIMDLSSISSSNDSITEKGSNESKKKGDKCTKTVDCTYCKRKFPWKSSLSRHFLTHTGLKPHKCPKCPLSFTTKSNRDRHLFRQHKDSHGATNSKPFQCTFCTNCFSTKGKLKKHNLLKHSASCVSPCKSNISQDSADCIDSDSDTLDCHVCGCTFKSQHDLLSHLTEAHPKECSEEYQNKGAQTEFTIKAEPVDTENASDHQTPSQETDSQPSVSNSQVSEKTSTPKKTSSSLMLLFAAAQQAHSVENPKLNSVDNKKTSNNLDANENSLILNLLGLKDPEFLDEMLDSAVRSHIKKEKTDNPC